MALTVPSGLSPADAAELDRFPDVLKLLLQQELDAGNSIVEVGHAFPAPPAGAWVKLARVVTTHPRASGDGIDYRSRNSTLSSGEFTDPGRIFFIVEPPGHCDETAAGTSASEVETGAAEMGEESTSAAFSTPQRVDPPRLPRRGAPRIHPGVAARAARHIEHPGGATWSVTCRDSRSPVQLQADLEGSMKTVLVPVLEGDLLCLLGSTRRTVTNLRCELRFEACGRNFNDYAVTVHASWPEVSADMEAYCRNSSRGWFETWTLTLLPLQGSASSRGTPDPLSSGPQSSLYQHRVKKVFAAEARFVEVASVQSGILAALRSGYTIGWSHKEGDTRFLHAAGRFMRVDSGEHAATVPFADDASFLAALHRHFAGLPWTQKDDPDAVTWRLLFRQLSTP